MLSSLETGLRLSGYERGARIVVALSGGPDSTALAQGLSELLAGSTQIVAAHFNHRTRGKASDADEQFVRELCAGMGIELHIGQAPEPSDGMSEAAARELRYQFLQRVADELGAPFVAVAHTADDQAETVLLRIVRGTGVQGLAAMPYARPIAAGSRTSLIRPLLEVTRADINTYLSEHGIQARHDESNDDIRYARNRIRHHVMPALTEINPAVVQSITRLAKIAREHNDFIKAEVSNAIQQIDLPNLYGIQDLPPPVAARLLEAMHSEVAESGAQLDMHHIEAALRMLKRLDEAELHLPGNVVLRHRAGETTLVPRYSAVDMAGAPIMPAKLSIPGSVELSNGSRMTADIVSAPDSFADAPRRGHRYAYVTHELASRGHVTVRGRIPGDRYQPLGMGYLKVQDLMVNAKVPKSQRDSVPIVVDPHLDRIAWVVGFPPADWARVPRDDTMCVKLEVHEDVAA